MNKVRSLRTEEEKQTALEKMIILACNQAIINIEHEEEKLKSIDEKFQEICKIDTYFGGMIGRKLENVVTETLSFHIGVILDSIENYHNTLELAKKLNESENQKIMEFFKQELPDVYAKLKREFRNRRKVAD